MKRRTIFLASLLMMLGLAVMPGTGSAEMGCAAGGCWKRYTMCLEMKSDHNPDDYVDAICLAEYNSCVADCNARRTK